MAAADYADGRADCPPELELYFLCQRYGHLPESGGVRDQLAGELERMAAAFDAYSSWKFYKANCPPGHESQFMQQYPDIWRLVRRVIEARDDG